MQEATQTDNALIRGEETSNDPTPAKLYDPEARNRFEYEVRENGSIFEVGHVFGSLSDERYVQWQREFKIKGNDENDVDEQSLEASVRLWDDIIIEVENIDFEAGTDWKAFIPYSEKIDALNDYLAVAIADETEDQKAVTKRTIGPGQSSQTVITEAWTNGDVAKQKHVLVRATMELKKKYSRIQSKRFKQETIKGLHRRQPKVEFVPQDEKLGELYDEMKISEMDSPANGCRSGSRQHGFAPHLRFEG
jgi:hypothetical protein